VSTTYPSVTDDVQVVADAVVALGAMSDRGTIDLRGSPAKVGAYLFVAIGRGGSTAIGTAVNVIVRPTLGNDAKAHPNGLCDRVSSVAAATATTVDANSAAGQNVLNVTSTTGYTAGQCISIQDGDDGVTRLEFARISKITNAGASGELVLDRNLQYEHTAAQADKVRNQADVFSDIWLAGGKLWEVRFDYGASATGEAITVRARAQQIDNWTTAS